MHEYGIVSNLIKIALDRLAQESPSKILFVELEFGEFLFIDPKNARMAFDSLIPGTILEGSELKIRYIPGKIRCASCGYEGGVPLPKGEHFHFVDYLLTCPKCNAVPQILQGLECAVTQIEIEAIED